MDELIIAKINPDMGNGSALEAKKQQIARVQFCQLDACPNQTDGPCTVWQLYSCGLIENVTHKAAAIKTGFRAYAAPVVRNSNLIEGQLQHTLDSIRQAFQFGLIRTIDTGLLHGAGLFSRQDAPAQKQYTYE